MIYKGVVSNVSWFDYKGDKLWSFQLNNDKSVYYRTGKIKPRCEVGEFVIFEGVQGKQGNSVNVDTKNFQVKAAEAEASGVQVTGKPVAIVERKAGNDYWEKKEARDIVTQARIERQSTRNSALEFIKILLSQDALKLPTKQADKLETLEQLLSHYQEQFLKDNSGEIKEDESKDVAKEETLEENIPY